MTEKKSLAAWFEEKFGNRSVASSSAPTESTPSPEVMVEEAGLPLDVSPISAPETDAAPADETAETSGLHEQTDGVSDSSEAMVDDPVSVAAPLSECETSVAPADATGETPSLYEQLGGASAVDAAVDIFYRKVLSDERISHFFDDVDMAKQAAKQKAFLTMAFGGPHHYTGKDMRAAHAHLADRSWKKYSLIHRMQTQRKSGGKRAKMERGLKDSHFDAVLENLGDTLAELGIADHLIAQVIAIAESTRDDVLGR